MLIRSLIICCLILWLGNVYGQQTEKVYLSGTGPDDAKQWEFFCMGGMNANKWTKIAVPSCWETQGFGKYDYGFAKDSVRGKEKGLYKYNFSIPAGWKDKVIKLVFEGVMTDAEVMINGQSAGPIHQGAYYAFKYDISKLVRYGQPNLLQVTVSKHSGNQSVNEAERKADFWIFGGIFRPVYLEALPAIHIDHIAIDARMDGTIKAEFDVTGKADLILCDLFSAKKEKIGSNFGVTMGNYPGKLVMNARVNSVIPWTPENPVLYTLVFEVYKDKKLLHTISKKIGFRTVEVKQRDGIYLNGVKIKMKGVNRSPFRPETGRTLSAQQSLEDLLLIRDMNMNAVRCSHYPPDDHFLDACDSLGIMVMDELAGWHGSYDTKQGTILLKEMIGHDVNHPSIVLWANGNEGGHNLELDSLFTAFDIQQRPVVHPWQLFGGIETQHYREYNYGIGNYENGKEIVMPTEFLHGQFDGGHGAGLEDYWEKMWHNPLSAGGFLWDFSDQAVVRKDKNDSLDTDKFRAADGIVGPHHEKEGSYYAIKEIWSPVVFERKEITRDFDGVLRIENRSFYTNTNEFNFYYTLSMPATLKPYEVNGKILSPSIKPGEKGQLKIELPKNWRSDFYVLNIKVADRAGREILTKSFPIIRAGYLEQTMLDQREVFSKPVLTQTDSAFIVNTANVHLQFHRRTGLLETVKWKSATIPLSNGPVLQEGENNFGNFKAEMTGDTLLIRSAYDKSEHYNTLQWTIYPSGLVRMEVNYFPSAYFTNFVGVNFSYPEASLKEVSYLGDGPYRVWKNRMKGVRFGYWNKQYNNTETGEYPWKYPEFKGYYANLYWCIFKSTDHSFVVTPGTEGVFLRLFTPKWKTDQWHNYELVFPSGDISFMQGISSIGSKTQRNETTGPMGMKNIFYDYEKDPSRALKLVLYFSFDEAMALMNE